MVNYKDRSHLSTLYPEPKTYEQREQDDKIRQQAYRRHWPKRPYLNIAVYGSVFIGLSVWFAQNLNAWWFSSDDKGITMATVFFTFAMGLGLVFLLIAWINFTNKLFSHFQGAVQIFWLIYIGLVLALLAFWLSGRPWEYTNFLWIPMFTALHFIVIFLSTWRILKSS